jgi:galactokinase
MTGMPDGEAESGERAVLERAVGAFRKRLGRAPEWAAVAPGRVNLIGEHTDYNGGFVLPIAIDRVCAAVGGRGWEMGRTRVLAVDLGEEASLDASAEPVAGDGSLGTVRAGSWISYVAGVIAQYQRLGGADGDGAGGLAAGEELDIAVSSSVPLGSGLSSSAALEVAVATLLEQAWMIEVRARTKALLCQRAEQEFAGVPCGIMDQFVSVMGRRGCALLIDCRSEETRAVPMPPESEAVVVVMDTGVRHALGGAGGEYAKRRAACERAAGKLGVRLLRDADEGMVERGRAVLSDEEWRCARHVVGENRRTVEAAGALERGDLAAVGRLMNESHESLRGDYRVSCAELDTVVEAARGAEGVFGARMTGGGFGGCAVAVVRPGALGGVVGAVAQEYRARHGCECRLFVTAACEGARAIPL